MIKIYSYLRMMKALNNMSIQKLVMNNNKMIVHKRINMNI